LTPPFHSPGAVANSAYTGFEHDQLVRYDGATPSRMQQEVHAALRAVLDDPEFPCLGAKSVLNQASYRFGLYQELATAPTTEGLALDLFLFSREQERIAGEFHSFIATFVGPKTKTLASFEKLLWRQLAQLHAIDREHFDWNSSVSADPSDAHFSFSFAGCAYFVVGLSPAHPRWARRFPWPTLVFNDHFQFERLREQHRFERLRDAIRTRDDRLHGGHASEAADYGTHSEAPQYAGRRLSGEWRCPVNFDEEIT